MYVHASGELSAGRVFVPANKNDAQGYGSAQTYARRYGLQLAFGLATEDDDGNAASKLGEGHSNNSAVSPRPDQSIVDAINLVNAAATLDALAAQWTALGKAFQKDARVMAAKDARKLELSPPANNNAFGETGDVAFAN
jgi:hypothetical protein